MLSPPVKELKGFKKVKIGARETVDCGDPRCRFGCVESNRRRGGLRCGLGGARELIIILRGRFYITVIIIIFY